MDKNISKNTLVLRYNTANKNKLKQVGDEDSIYYVNDDYEDNEEKGMMMMMMWPPRSYSCSFCKREFRSAQALGGHMNVHRRDRAHLRQLSLASSLYSPPNHSNSTSNSNNSRELNLNLPPSNPISDNNTCFANKKLKSSTSIAIRPRGMVKSVVSKTIKSSNCGLKKVEGLIRANDDNVGVTNEGLDLDLDLDLDLELRLGYN